MLPACKCLTGKFDMRIVRRGNVNDIYVGIMEHFMKIVVYLLYTVLLRKCDCLLVCAVADRVEMLSHML